MKLLALLSALLFSVYSANLTVCNPDLKLTPDPYVPEPYEAAWGVKAGAGRTNAPFPSEFTDPIALLTDPYMIDLLGGVLSGTVLLGGCLFFYPVFLCIRYLKCCAGIDKMCCCCCQCFGPFNGKGAMGKTPARIIMLLLGFLLVITTLTGFSGQGDVGNVVTAFKESSAIITSTAKDINKGIDNIAVALSDLEKALENIGNGACDFVPSQSTDNALIQASAINDGVNGANEAISNGGTVMKEAIGEMTEPIKAAGSAVTEISDTIGSTLSDVTTILDDVWEGIGVPFCSALASLFVIVVLLSTLGTCMPNSHPKVRKCLFCCTIFTGWSFTGITIIIFSVLGIFGIIIGDVCTPSPLENIVSIVSEPIVTYYVGCDGVSPLQGQADTMVNVSNTTYAATCTMLTAIANDTYNFAHTDPTLGDLSILLVRNDASACSSAKDRVDSGVDDTLTNLNSFLGTATSCKVMNLPLGVLMEDGFCNGLGSGFYKMYCSQLSAVFFCLVLMYVLLPSWDVFDESTDKRLDRIRKNKKVFPEEGPTGDVEMAGVNSAEDVNNQEQDMEAEDQINGGEDKGEAI